RENEFAQLRAGIPYLDILKQGGGIHSTVNATRNATKEELFEKAWKSLDEMLLHGVTTVEAKSGYGLNLETEITQLEVAKELNEYHPIDIVSTYLGAHTVPKEYQDNKDGYIKSLVQDMKIIKEKDLATFIDVFCEENVFTKEESKYILEQGKLIGLIPKIHADEIVSLGGTRIAVSLDASSADHLMAITDQDIKLLANSDVVANLLPNTSFYLNKGYAPARKLIDNNCAVALSSDYNPGSSPSENLQFTMQLAANKLRMTANEILAAVTINGAYNLRRSDFVGSFEKGKDADIVIMNSKNIDYIMYHFGINHVIDVFKKGEIVVRDKSLV
ncbi:MAG: imidazolonepropionase, partial [Candidatus Izimaplasma sp.]|nr:imidazolonepropionase [Candidatus Izimaplasma bacterium]